ncbi:MAG: transposase [Ruminococcus sp.]|nr:transposase [Ruminococcus sp.]
MEKSTRKYIRLVNYDYSSNGLYFITICTRDRVHYFSRITEDQQFVGADIIRPIVTLTEIGKILDFSINDVKNHYDNVDVVKYCIMPDHVHLIISIMNDVMNENGGRMISAPTVSTIIGSLKRFVSKTTGISLWQKSFHDHIIRSEKEFLEICGYIDNNPINWVNHIYNQNFWR